MANIINTIKVSDEDRQFIKDMSKLSDEKKTLIKGIIIGLQLEENQNRQQEKVS